MTKFESSPVLATDFDGTVCLTSERDDGILNVDAAYTQAIAEVFGSDEANAYGLAGGHNHRTPLEIVYSLRPDLGYDEAAQLAESITRNKLDILIGQIGRKMANGRTWPSPIDGFSETWTDLSEDNDVDTLVISAGHTAFIRHWFDHYNLPRPKAMVTHEVTTNLNLQLPAEAQAKPHARLMWLGLAALDNLSPFTLVYAGDDPVKDKGLAENSGATFVLIRPESAYEDWELAGDLVVPTRSI